MSFNRHNVHRDQACFAGPVLWRAFGRVARQPKRREDGCEDCQLHIVGRFFSVRFLVPRPVLVIGHHPHVGRQPRHLGNVSTVAIAAGAGHPRTERASIRPIAITLQGPVAVILADPACIVAQIAGHSGRCIRPSNQPIPIATMAVVYGCVSMVRRNHFSNAAALSRAAPAASAALSLAWP